MMRLLLHIIIARLQSYVVSVHFQLGLQLAVATLIGLLPTYIRQAVLVSRILLFKRHAGDVE